MDPRRHRQPALGVQAALRRISLPSSPPRLLLTALLSALALTGCASTDEQRFPLDTFFADRLWADVEMARQALPAYQRMGDDLKRRGQIVATETAYG